jgi:peptide-N4-(N-acetyl-beta-glucosaminyl)asparagine amidase
MPVDRFHEEARKQLTEKATASPLQFEDFVIKALLHWFKHEFFQWVNEAPCEKGCIGKTQGIGMGQPTQEEVKYGGHRVELYRCTTCSHVTRFPRYNHPGKLLETHRGRCGEWANVFTLCVISLGFQARYVLDFTDHVWTEYYSDALKRWVHLDSCEAAFDTPLVYESGWGKKLNYIFALGSTEIVDVILRYTRQIKEVYGRRNMIPEADLKVLVEQLNDRLRSRLDTSERERLKKQIEREMEELFTEVERLPGAAEFLGRQSGSLQWRQERGELGPGSGSKDKH